MKCLVGYVTKTGTTEEVAACIGQILQASGAEVEIKSIDSVSDVEAYDLLVLGSPINGMRVLPEFKAFLEGKVAGSGKLVDLFIVSYLYGPGRKIWKRAIRKELEQLKTLVKADSVEIVAGRLPQALPGAARFIFGTPRDLPLDTRDWDKIEAWAGSLARGTRT
ncbi:MAG: flavodoxin domain-containing protein [Spirochaetes bacterium]|nr:flavodoxin domain-containing protein [Spirochaetota bacterium]